MGKNYQQNFPVGVQEAHENQQVHAAENDSKRAKTKFKQTLLHLQVGLGVTKETKLTVTNISTLKALHTT